MHLPRQRKLSKDAYQDTKNMLSVKVNKNMIQQHIYQQSGKVVTLKNLHNIASDNTTVNVENLVQEMRKFDGKNYTEIANTL